MLRKDLADESCFDIEFSIAVTFIVIVTLVSEHYLWPAYAGILIRDDRQIHHVTLSHEPNRVLFLGKFLSDCLNESDMKMHFPTI